MILFKVDFKNNRAVTASFTLPHRQVEWKEHPYNILSIEVYASNNMQALELAQAKADVLLKENNGPAR